MNLTCPACSKPITLPDQLAGKIAACPACKQNFAAPKVVPGAAPEPEDELALQTSHGEAPVQQGPPDLSKLQFCPNCGGPWKKNANECGKCRFNATLGAVLKPAQVQRRSFRIDYQKIFLYTALIAVAFGIYWLVNNYSALKRKGDAMYDNASREAPSADQVNPMAQKGARSKD